MCDDLAADEVLDAARSRPPNRLLPVLCVLAFVAIVLAELPRRHHDAAAPAPARPPVAVPSVIRAVATSEHVAFVAGYSFVTRGHALVSVRSANGDNPQAAIDPAASSYVLAGDESRQLIWVVGGTRAQAFDAPSLGPRTVRLELPLPATDAVVLDGALYVSTASSVLRVVPRSAPVVVSRTGARHLAADPVRHRVLVLSGSRVGVLGSAREVPLPGPGSAMAVVAGTVWVAVEERLLQLDPRTLRTLSSGAFSSPITIAATGRQSLLIGTGPGLSCVSIRLGGIVDGWSSVARPVGIDEHGTIYSLPARGVPATVAYNACPN